MEQIEERIQRLPWAQASPALKTRIFDEPRRTPTRLLFMARKIAVGWAAVWVLLAGLLGFFVGQQQTPVGSAVVAPTNIDLQVVETGSGQNLFDMTPQASEILPGDIVASHIPTEEY